MKTWRIQLMDHVTRKAILDAGGKVQVCAQGTYNKVALLDSAGATASNPSAITNGLIEFFTANSVGQVDLYGMGPGGDWFVVKALDASGPNEIFIDTNRASQVAKIPFSSADASANTEKDTGFDIPDEAQVLPWGMGVWINTIQTHANAAIDVGILSTEAGGDADGFMDAIPLGVAGFVKAKVGFTNGTATPFIDLTGGTQEFTFGALVLGTGTKVALAEGADSNGDTGFYLLEPFVGDGTATSVSYTVGTAFTTANGLIVLPYIKAPAA